MLFLKPDMTKKNREFFYHCERFEPRSHIKIKVQFHCPGLNVVLNRTVVVDSD